MAASFIKPARTPQRAAADLRRAATRYEPHAPRYAAELRQLAARLLAALNLE